MVLSDTGPVTFGAVSQEFSGGATPVVASEYAHLHESEFVRNEGVPVKGKPLPMSAFRGKHAHRLNGLTYKVFEGYFAKN
ncbi:MAG: hypothetical protein EOM62_20025, partial [Bacteroidia bacterium]|nr:hypothetical protein [Bacteroidia bacterium]